MYVLEVGYIMKFFIESGKCPPDLWYGSTGKTRTFDH